ncbi:MAG TPA: hypothetical protein VF808_00675 [Ktedonobacterales bacterium]
MSVGWARIGRERGRSSRFSGLALGCVALLALTGCALGGGNGSGGAGGQTLSSLPWCAQPQFNFVDSSSSSQKAITSWDQVKGQLGFTPYLPPSLPKGSCLDLLGGAIHDPIFGGHLSVTWVLPNVGPISFSEAPAHGAAASAPQCPQSGQSSDATTICIGVVGGTNVTVAAHLTQSQLTAYFNQLQPATDWQPAPAS